TAARISARPTARVVAVCGARSGRGFGAGAFSPPPPQPPSATAAAAAAAVLIAAGRVARRLRRRAGLPQQRPRRLFEDLAPGADLLLLGGDVLDDLAHARRGDLDPVAFAVLVEALVVLRELERHGLEAVLGDP